MLINQSGWHPPNDEFAQYGILQAFGLNLPYLILASDDLCICPSLQ